MSSSSEATPSPAPGPDTTPDAHGPDTPGATDGLRPPSVLVLTKDEEINIRQCLETLSWSDDVVVLDSLSTDRTCAIAEEFPNVRVVKRKFDTWSKHSNWALDNIDFKHPWVYYSDADERVTPELRDEILRRTNDPNEDHVAYRLRYKNMFMGRWVRRGGLYPVWIIRLYRPDKIRYEDREVNAHPVVDGSMGELEHHFIHYSFNKGLVPWFMKHNSYSDMEAKEALRITEGSLLRQLRRAIEAKDPLIRRRGIKNLSFFVPFRPFVRFAYMLFARLGLLDGKAGFHYASMISMYEYWIELKTIETRRDWHARTETLARKMLSPEAFAPPLTPTPTTTTDAPADASARDGASSGAPAREATP